MPIKWTPELDTILLHGVFEECNISFTKALCEKLAQRVSATGAEASYKSVENRLYTWKKKSVGPGPAPTTSTPSKTPTTPKTPASRPKATPRKKKAVNTSESDNDSLSDVMDSPSVKKGSNKRAKAMPKRGYAESENELGSEDVEEEYKPLGKRVKAEPMEDDGEFAAFGEV